MRSFLILLTLVVTGCLKHTDTASVYQLTAKYEFDQPTATECMEYMNQTALVMSGRVTPTDNEPVLQPEDCTTQEIRATCTNVCAITPTWLPCSTVCNGLMD